MISLTDLRLDWNIDVLVPPDAGPGLRDRHLGGDHTVAVVAVRDRAGRRGRGGEGRWWGRQVVVTGIHVVHVVQVDVVVLK